VLLRAAVLATAVVAVIGVAQHASSGEWRVWKGMLPPNEGLPGDPPGNQRHLDPALEPGRIEGRVAAA
jgi:hypothetical protein